MRSHSSAILAPVRFIAGYLDHTAGPDLVGCTAVVWAISQLYGFQAEGGIGSVRFGENKRSLHVCLKTTELVKSSKTVHMPSESRKVYEKCTKSVFNARKVRFSHTLHTLLRAYKCAKIV